MQWIHSVWNLHSQGQQSLRILSIAVLKISEYLNDPFRDNESTFYSILSPEEISKFVIDDSPLSITNCMKLHMISYFPNWSVQPKVNICSYVSCIEGEFISCLIEKGKTVQVVDEASDNNDKNDSCESEFENDVSDDESETESYELRAESVNSVLNKNTTIALYFPSNSLELFYLCKVFDFGIADKNMVDDHNHLISKGSKYIKCQYYWKQKKSPSVIHYKLFPKIVYVLPTQVLPPLVNLDENYILKMDEYQWLCDSIKVLKKYLKKCSNSLYLIIMVFCI